MSVFLLMLEHAQVARASTNYGRHSTLIQMWRVPVVKLQLTKARIGRDY